MRPPAGRLLALREARVFLAGQACSSFGDSALWLATAVWVKSLTASSGAAGLVIFFYMAPMLLAPVSGLLVDRRRRRPLLIATNAITGCAVLLLLLVHGAGQLWLIYAVMVLYGLSRSVLSAGQSALLATMIPAELLADANGAMRTIAGTLSLVAPLAGAGLYSLAGPHVVVVLDALTFAAPVVSLLALRVAEPPVPPRGADWRAELGAGVRHIGATAVLRRVTAAAACAVLGYGFTETIVFAVADQGLHRPPSFVGVLVAIEGIGAVLGGLTAAALVRRLGERSLIVLGLVVIGAGALLEIPPSLPAVIAGVVLIGLSVPWVLVGLTTLLQRLTPPELQGRVYAAAEALIATPQTISIAAGAALIEIVGYRALLGGMAAASVIAGLYLRARTDAPPEAIPSAIHC
jgi:MFS family permease